MPFSGILAISMASPLSWATEDLVNEQTSNLYTQMVKGNFDYVIFSLFTTYYYFVIDYLHWNVFYLIFWLSRYLNNHNLKISKYFIYKYPKRIFMNNNTLKLVPLFSLKISASTDFYTRTSKL